MVHALDECLGVLDYRIGVIAKRARIHDGIAPVHVNIAAGVEHPVRARGAGLAPRDKADVVRRLGILRGGGLGRRGNEGAVAHGAVAAVVAVHRDQQRNFGMLLISGVLPVHSLGIAALIAQTALMVCIQHALNIGLGRRTAHLHKQLPDFFVECHPGNGILHPLHALIIQIKRLCS